MGSGHLLLCGHLLLPTSVSSSSSASQVSHFLCTHTHTQNIPFCTLFDGGWEAWEGQTFPPAPTHPPLTQPCSHAWDPVWRNLNLPHHLPCYPYACLPTPGIPSTTYHHACLHGGCWRRGSTGQAATTCLPACHFMPYPTQDLLYYYLLHYLGTLPRLDLPTKGHLWSLFTQLYLCVVTSPPYLLEWWMGAGWRSHLLSPLSHLISPLTFSSHWFHSSSFSSSPPNMCIPFEGLVRWITLLRRGGGGPGGRGKAERRGGMNSLFQDDIFEFINLNKNRTNLRII